MSLNVKKMIQSALYNLGRKSVISGICNLRFKQFQSCLSRMFAMSQSTLLTGHVDKKSSNETRSDFFIIAAPGGGRERERESWVSEGQRGKKAVYTSETANPNKYV